MFNILGGKVCCVSVYSIYYNYACGYLLNIIVIIMLVKKGSSYPLTLLFCYLAHYTELHNWCFIEHNSGDEV